MKLAVAIATNILVPLGITAAASAVDVEIDAKIQINKHDSGTTTLIIWNEEMNDVIKIVPSSWRF